MKYCKISHRKILINIIFILVFISFYCVFLLVIVYMMVSDINQSDKIQNLLGDWRMFVALYSFHKSYPLWLSSIPGWDPRLYKWRIIWILECIYHSLLPDYGRDMTCYIKLLSSMVDWTLELWSGINLFLIYFCQSILER